MKKALLSTFIIFSFFAYAQAPAIEWAKSYGGTNDEDVHEILETQDGGYIFAGWTFSTDGDITSPHSGGDAWIAKTDYLGTIEWQKSFGGSSWDVAYSIQQCNDGGYIVTGLTRSNDGDVSGHHDGSTTENDVWLVKLDGNGSIQWQKCYGGTGSDYGKSVQQTSDGGYIIGAISNTNDGDVSGHHGAISGNGQIGTSDYWLIKTDNTGNIQWQKSLGGTDNDFVTSIKQTTDGGYIVSGTVISDDGDVTGYHYCQDCWWYGDYWVVKLDQNGTLEWQKTLGGSDDDSSFEIQQTNDGGYIVAGYSMSPDGDVTGLHSQYSYDYWLVKLSTTGTIEWQKCYGSTGDEGGVNREMYISVVQTLDGGFAVAGNAGEAINGDLTTSIGEQDYWLVKTDSVGNIQWQNCYGGTQDDLPRSIKQTADGGFVVAGFAYSTDINNTFSQNIWVLKLVGDNLVVNKNSKNVELQIYPNPAKNLIQIANYDGKVQVFDLKGKLLIETDATQIDITSLSKGTYIVQLENQVERFVKD